MLCRTAVILAASALCAAGASTVAAAEAEEASHAAADADAHGGEPHHNQYDLTHSNPGPQQEDPAEFKSDLAIWTLVVFVLLLLVLRKFAWGPIMEALQKREEFVADQISQAKQQNEQAHQLLAAHEQKLAAAQEEIRQMMDQSRRDADQQKQQILVEAEQAAQAQKERAVQEIEAAKNSALNELAERSVDTAIGLAGRIVQRQLTRDEHADLVREAIDNFPHRN